MRRRKREAKPEEHQQARAEGKPEYVVVGGIVMSVEEAERLAKEG